jgi:hypothetical protein
MALTGPQQYADVVNTAPAQLEGTAYGKRYDIARSALQPSFTQARGTASEALGTRGLGRSSMYANTQADITGKEMLATQDLYSSLLGQASQESMQRDFQGMETSKFNAQLRENARQFDEKLKWEQYQASEASNDAKRAAAAQAKADTWKTIGKTAGQLGAAYLTGGASLAVPGMAPGT